MVARSVAFRAGCGFLLYDAYEVARRKSGTIVIIVSKRKGRKELTACLGIMLTSSFTHSALQVPGSGLCIA
jgi:hypothetical protein